VPERTEIRLLATMSGRNFYVHEGGWGVAKIKNPRKYLQINILSKFSTNYTN
jgi:hypothetical protein